MDLNKKTAEKATAVGRRGFAAINVALDGAVNYKDIPHAVSFVSSSPVKAGAAGLASDLYAKANNTSEDTVLGIFTGNAGGAAGLVFGGAAGSAAALAVAPAAAPAVAAGAAVAGAAAGAYTLDYAGRKVGNFIADKAEEVSRAVNEYGAEKVGELMQNSRGTAWGNVFGNSYLGHRQGVGHLHPIIIDLDGDGIEVSAAGSADFDHDGDGYRERSAWAAADDAFLVIDLAKGGGAGPDGEIDQGKELAFTTWLPEAQRTGASDMQALAKIFDSNRDGVLDARWSEFRIWQDKNQNGVVDHDLGELRTLDGKIVKKGGEISADAEKGARQITSLNLNYTNGRGYGDRSDDIVSSNAILHGMSRYHWRSAGENGAVQEGVSDAGDVSLAYTTKGWKRLETPSGFQYELEGTDAALEHVVITVSMAPNLTLTQ